MKLERFHASSNKHAIVQYHPQADSEFAKSQGYVVLKLEDWVVADKPDFADWLAGAMNDKGAIRCTCSAPIGTEHSVYCPVRSITASAS